VSGEPFHLPGKRRHCFPLSSPGQFNGEKVILSPPSRLEQVRQIGALRDEVADGAGLANIQPDDKGYRQAIQPHAGESLPRGEN